MKKYDGIVKRVREREEKAGISYQKTDGTAFKVIKFFYTVVSAWGVLMCALFIVSGFMRISGTDRAEELKSYMIVSAVLTVLYIAGYVLLCLKIYSVSLALSGISPVGIISLFGVFYNGGDGLLGFSNIYYTRFLIPFAVCLVLGIVLNLIALRAEKKTNAEYKRIVDELYSLYSAEENPQEKYGEWEDFLKNYDYSEYKKYFSEGMNGN